MIAVSSQDAHRISHPFPIALPLRKDSLFSNESTVVGMKTVSIFILIVKLSQGNIPHLFGWNQYETPLKTHGIPIPSEGQKGEVPGVWQVGGPKVLKGITGWVL